MHMNVDATATYIIYVYILYIHIFQLHAQRSDVDDDTDTRDWG